MKRKLVGLREAWVEEEAVREARQRERLDTFAKVTLIQVLHCSIVCPKMQCSIVVPPGECGAAGEAGEGDV